jgi:cystathionine beta-lyase
MKGELDPSTRLIHSATAQSATIKTVGPPIQRGSTVLLDAAAHLYGDGHSTYGRGGLSTHDALTTALAELEGARSVKLFPSGLAAMTASIIAVLKSGDEVLLTDAVYKPTRRFCDQVLARFGVTPRYYPANLDANSILALASEATRLVVLESPGSLTMEMQDVPAIARMARDKGILTLIDNTWAAGSLFKPLQHGVDISVQSLTKYVCGHSDVFMGSAATCNASLAQALDQTVWDFGWAVSPDDAYQMLRGLRTLHARMARHGASSLAIAAWLSRHSKVANVLHPALPGAPGHDIWTRDYDGSAGLFSVVLTPCGNDRVEGFLDALRLFGLGFSWGGFESLALNCDPQFSVRHFETKRSGPVIRLSTGLEAPDDLIADLDQALSVI